jgi:hypothetical protein
MRRKRKGRLWMRKGDEGRGRDGSQRKKRSKRRRVGPSLPRASLPLLALPRGLPLFSLVFLPSWAPWISSSSLQSFFQAPTDEREEGAASLTREREEEGGEGKVEKKRRVDRTCSKEREEVKEKEEKEGEE